MLTQVKEEHYVDQGLLTYWKQEDGSRLCGCLFCNSKCPKCGAEEVEINLNLTYRCTCTNHAITLELDAGFVEVNCSDCGYEYADDEEGDHDHAIRLYDALLISASMKFANDGIQYETV